MISRRNLIKSLGLSAFAFPTLASNGFNQTTSPIDSKSLFPSPEDPAYWKKIRKQFILAPDKVFFNTGTVGAMPKPVVDAMVKHIHTMATDVADWAYKDDNKEQYISGPTDERCPPI